VNTGTNPEYSWSQYEERLCPFCTALVVVMSACTSAFAQSKAFDVSNMDRTANACDDFFQFADGNWIKNTQIPPIAIALGKFNILAESNRDVLHEILEKAQTEKAAQGQTTFN